MAGDDDTDGNNGSVLFDASVDEGYQFYRIPSLLRVAAAAGTWLLAFCEGRQQRTDHGKVDIVLKRSADDGVTWSQLSVVHGERHATIGNPTPLFDSATLEVVLFFCRENSEILSTRSTDAGISWSLPKTIGWPQPPEWAWLATGPPAALRLASGRYVLPCDGYLRLPGARPGATRFYQASTVFSFVLLSDDRGATWRQGPLLDGGNECQVARPTDRQSQGVVESPPPAPFMHMHIHRPRLSRPRRCVTDHCCSTCAAASCVGCSRTRTTAARHGVTRGPPSRPCPTATAKARRSPSETAASWSPPPRVPPASVCTPTYRPTGGARGATLCRRPAGADLGQPALRRPLISARSCSRLPRASASLGE